MSCYCSGWAREGQSMTDLHHKFCPHYPRATEENVYLHNCPHCKTPGETCHKCGAILGEIIEPFPLPSEDEYNYTSPPMKVVGQLRADNWHVDPDNQ